MIGCIISQLTGNSQECLTPRLFLLFCSVFCPSVHYFNPLSPLPPLFSPALSHSVPAITDESISRLSDAERVQQNLVRTSVNNNSCLSLIRKAIITCTGAMITCLIKAQMVISAQMRLLLLCKISANLRSQRSSRLM